MWLNVSVDDVVVVAILQGQENLPQVVRANGLRVDEASGRALDDLEAQIGPGHVLEHHVEHSLGAAKTEEKNIVNVKSFGFSEHCGEELAR